VMEGAGSQREMELTLTDRSRWIGEKKRMATERRSSKSYVQERCLLF